MSGQQTTSENLADPEDRFKGWKIVNQSQGHPKALSRDAAAEAAGLSAAGGHACTISTYCGRLLGSLRPAAEIAAYFACSSISREIRDSDAGSIESNTASAAFHTHSHYISKALLGSNSPPSMPTRSSRVVRSILKEQLFVSVAAVKTND